MKNYYFDGLDAFKKGNYPQAIFLFKKCLEENPEEYEGLFFLGEALFLSDAIHDAIEYLTKYIDIIEKILQQSENLTYALDVLGKCYELTERTDKASEFYLKAINLNPNQASARHNYGLLNMKLAEEVLQDNFVLKISLFDEAYKFLIEALKICADNPNFLHSVASWHEKYIEILECLDGDILDDVDKNFNLAIDYYKKALLNCNATNFILKNIIQTNLADCLAQYGHHLYRIKNLPRAIEIYEETIKFNPKHIAATNQKGMIYTKQNLFAKAREEFSNILIVLDLDKNENFQDIADAYLNIAYTFRKQHLWKEAELNLNQAKRYAPDDSAIYEEEQELINDILNDMQVNDSQDQAFRLTI